MWNEYIFAIIAAIALLYLPGYLVSRGLKLSRPLAISFAPVISVFAYTTLPIIFYALDLSCSLTRILCPTVVVALLLYGYTLLRSRMNKGVQDELTLSHHDDIRLGTHSLSFDSVLFTTTIAIGSLVCLFLFSLSLSRPDAFYSCFDNATHLNCVQAFLDSGRWSTLRVSKYLAVENPLSSPTGTNDGFFYPAAWHDTVALVCLLAHTSVATASNALVTVICALVNPLGLLLLIRALLPKCRHTLMLAPILVSSSGAVPWVYPLSGPTLPNLLGMALLAPTLGLLVVTTSSLWARRHPLSCVTVAIASFTALTLAHPNTIFTAYIFCSAFGTHVLNARLKRQEDPSTSRPSRKRLLAITAFWAVLVGIWIICYQLPIFSSILGYRRDENCGLAQALYTLCLFRFGITEMQPLLTLAFVAGVIVCLRKRLWWLLFPVSYFSFCFVACRIDWDFVKYWFAGMWYMSAYRFASPIVTFALPLLCLGLDDLLGSACRLARRGAFFSRMSTRTLVAFLLALFCVVNFFPYSHYDIEADQGIETAFGRTNRKLRDIYGDKNEHVYSLDEIRFVDRVVELVGKDALVLNFPNDGSMFAYGINHLNAFYRDRSYKGQTPQSDTIRLHLDQYASSQEVHDAVTSTGAAYVLRLDEGVSYDDGIWLKQYSKRDVDEWAGIGNVGDDTPGFELVLAEGDMRLYRIIDAS